jgi:glycosyltransferase involved in cell wall biosynthesis
VSTLKIGFLVPGGVDRSGTHRVIPRLLWLIERVAAAGHETHVYALNQEPLPGRWSLLGAEVHNAGRRPRRIRMLAEIRSEHRRAKFDVLHAYWATPTGVVAVAAGKLLNVPVAVHLSGGELSDLRDIGYGGRTTLRGRAWLRAVVTGADRVTVGSAYMLAKARALGITAEYIPNGVALDRWKPLPPRARITGERARLIHVASLNLVKDQDTLLRAAVRLRADDVQFHLDIVGVDTLDGAVQARASSLDLDRHVTFHGPLTHEVLRPLMEEAHLMLLTSRHDAAPMVVREAAVAGVPVVGTAVGLVDEWAPNAAVAVPVGDDAALALAVESLLSDEARRMSLAANAHTRALAENADVTAELVLRLSREMVDGRARTAIAPQHVQSRPE